MNDIDYELILIVVWFYLTEYLIMSLYIGIQFPSIIIFESSFKHVKI